MLLQKLKKPKRNLKVRKIYFWMSRATFSFLISFTQKAFYKLYLLSTSAALFNGKCVRCPLLVDTCYCIHRLLIYVLTLTAGFSEMLT